MAVGKSKTQKGKKGSKKKAVDPFTRKDWYDIKSPALFTNRNVGKTFCNRTQGTKIASDNLKGRVFEVSLSDLQNESDAERSYKKFRLICEDVQGKSVLTNFHGFNLTTDKLRSMVKKWQTRIEAVADVKTTDGYVLRVFCIGFTEKMPNQTKKTCYAQSQQVKNIRRKMIEIIQRDVVGSELKEVVGKLIPDSMADDIRKACYHIFPLKDVHIRKVKVLRKPKFDVSKLMELHGEGAKGAVPVSSELGQQVDRPDNYEPPVLDSV